MTNTQKLLPDDLQEAAETMIAITDKLRSLIERENTSIAQNDAVAFTVAEKDKEEASWQYELASAEFSARLHDFRALETETIDKIESAQRKLREVANDSVRVLEKMPGIETE